jgi:hypothetical protein
MQLMAPIRAWSFPITDYRQLTSYTVPALELFSPCRYVAVVWLATTYT